MDGVKRPDWLLPPIEDLKELPLEQIATQLHRLKRYAGAVDWSVLEHSILVYSLIRLNEGTRKMRLWALLHDVCECWIGDALKPAKEIAGMAWGQVEQHYDSHVMRLADLTLTDEECEAVRRADSEACRMEFDDIDALNDRVYSGRDVVEVWLHLVRMFL